MENKELETIEQLNEIYETNSHKSTMENNNILIDLLLKTTKATSVINLMLDVNNFRQLETPILENQEYQSIQDNLINVINILNKEYIKLMELKNGTEN